MELLTDLAKQIQDQASTSQSQLEQYANKVREDMNAFKEENKRKTQELEKHVDEYINKMVAEYKPSPAKIEEFRAAKAAAFNEMLVETEKELEALAIKMNKSMDPVKSGFENSVKKASSFIKKSQDMVTKTIQENIGAASATKEKCEKIVTEHKKKVEALHKEAEQYAKTAKEITHKITEEAKAKSKVLADNHQKKYEALMAKYEASFKAK